MTTGQIDQHLGENVLKALFVLWGVLRLEIDMT